MQIKELIKILENAPDKNREVYIPHTEIGEISGSVLQTMETTIGYNFDDNNDLELSIIHEKKHYEK